MLLLYVNNSPRSNQDKGWTCLCDLGYLQQAHSPNYTDSSKQCVGCKGEVVQGEGIGLNRRTSLRAPDVIKVVATVHAGSKLPFWCGHSANADLAMAFWSLSLFIYSPRWCEIWSENRHLLLKYFFSLWTIIDYGRTLSLLHILQSVGLRFSPADLLTTC